MPAVEGTLRSPTEAMIGGTRRVTLGYSEGHLAFWSAYQYFASLLRLALFLSPSAYPLVSWVDHVDTLDPQG